MALYTVVLSVVMLNVIMLCPGELFTIAKRFEAQAGAYTIKLITTAIYGFL